MFYRISCFSILLMPSVSCIPVGTAFKYLGKVLSKTSKLFIRSHLILGWSKLDGYIFTEKICTQMNDNSTNMTLKDCSDFCEGNSTCNAINWAANETDPNVGGHCIFWKCPQPLPTFFEEPESNWTAYYNFGGTLAFPSELIEFSLRSPSHVLREKLPAAVLLTRGETTDGESDH